MLNASILSSQRSKALRFEYFAVLTMFGARAIQRRREKEEELKVVIYIIGESVSMQHRSLYPLAYICLKSHNSHSMCFYE